MSTLRTLLTLIAILIIFSLQGMPLQAAPHHSIRSISTQEADSLARVQVWYRDRAVPFHTVAKDVTIKLTGQTKVGKMSEVEFVASLILYPSDWTNVPLFKIKNRELADSLGLKRGEKASISQLFYPNEEYKLKEWYRGTDGDFDKAILELDEKVEIILLLRTHNLFIPLESTVQPSISPEKIKLEIFYNRMSISRWLFMAIFGYVLFLTAYLIWNSKIGFGIYNGQFGRVFVIIAFVLSGGLLAISLFNFIACWIIGGHIPLAGGEQVMMFMTMLLLAGGVSFLYNKPWIALGAITMAGFTALVSRLSSNDPIVTAISPALNSPWLAFHVSIIMASYAVFAIILPLSIFAIVNKKGGVKILKSTYWLNLIGVILLGIGIILGSLWAKGAWGSYWSWDPKENWAAVTFIGYLLPLIFWRKMKLRPRLYNMVLILSFLFMIVTYFGVNYMSSLHSYGT